MIDIGSSYQNIFSAILGAGDDPNFVEFKEIFLPPEDFVCKFQERFGYYPDYAPLNVCNQSFIQLYIPGCIPDIVREHLFTEISDSIQSLDFDPEVELTEAGFSTLIGLLGGTNARPMTKTVEIGLGDGPFIPVNMLGPMFLMDQTQYPSLWGNLTCSFNTDSSGLFKVLDGSLNVLDSSHFIPGINAQEFCDMSGFFAFSIESDAAVTFSDMTMFYTPCGNAEYLPTVSRLVSQLHNNIYTGL